MNRRFAKKVIKSLVNGYCDENGVNHNTPWSPKFHQDVVDKVILRSYRLGILKGRYEAYRKRLITKQ